MLTPEKFYEKLDSIHERNRQLSPNFFISQSGYNELRACIAENADLIQSMAASFSESRPLLHRLAQWGLHLLIEEFGLLTIFDIEHVNENNETPLHAAAAGGMLETTKYLIRKGAKIDALNSEGNSPLMVAVTACVEGVSKEHLKVIKFLIDQGANPTIAYNWGDNCLSFVMHELMIYGKLNEADWLTQQLKVLLYLNDGKTAPVLDASVQLPNNADKIQFWKKIVKADIDSKTFLEVTLDTIKIYSNMMK